MDRELLTASDALRAAIEASGRTHYSIGKDAGVVPQVIDRFMDGKELRSDTIDKLAKALDFVMYPRFSWFVAVCCDVELFPERGDVLAFMNGFLRRHNSDTRRISELQKETVFPDLWQKYHGPSQVRFDAFACEFSFNADSLAKHAAESLRKRDSKRIIEKRFKIIVRCRWPGTKRKDEVIEGDVGVLSECKSQS